MKIAIVDYEMGNLFSIQRACAWAGHEAVVTNRAEEILDAEGVVLPGVGAFGDAMAALRRRDLVSVLKDFAASGKPLMGVCLGMQLLMRESEEFGCHHGLAILEGRSVRLSPSKENGRTMKVPHVGWTRIFPAAAGGWKGTPLRGVAEGDYMYFVHSYYVAPDSPSVRLANSAFGESTFCAALRHKNIFACQFHPERSSAPGLTIYKNFFDEDQKGKEIRND